MRLAQRTLLGIDIGGSFTDIVASDIDTGALICAKTPTYANDLVRSVREALDVVGVPSSDVSVIRHGTTVVINAILTRTGEKTVLVTTEGFRDVLEIGRTNWPEPYNLFFERIPPLVPRELRLEVSERLAADGSVVRPVDLVEVKRIAQKVRELDARAVAVCFLHSYAHPKHEILVGEILGAELPDRYITLSHELTREFREYERTSTVVANAYVGGVIDRYISELTEHLNEGGFAGSLYLMESNGGVTSAALARRRPVALVESGPAAGVMATAEISRAQGIERSVAFDMGGTTAKACLVEDGDPLFTSEYFVPSYEHGFPLRVAALDLLEVGTGGGSIARVDNVGMLTVGPESAGAVPGPACFSGGGLEATVTDANLVLGRLNPQRFLDGDRLLDVGKASKVISEIAQKLGTDPTTAAAGIIRVANVNMAAAIRKISLDRGRDPRDFQLFAYGGGGPLHGVEIAREISIPRVIIPVMPGIFSALGMLLADLRQDFTSIYMRELRSMSREDLTAQFAKLEEDGEKWAAEAGSEATGRRTLRYCDCRYRGQEFTLMISVRDVANENVAEEIRAAFESEYELRYGHAFHELPVEVVGLRTVEYVGLPKPSIKEIGKTERSVTVWGASNRLVHFESIGFVDTPTLSRSSLEPDVAYGGPLVVEEYSATTVISPGDQLFVDQLGQMVIDLGIGSHS